MKKLLKLETVIHPGVKDLRKIYGTIESHVRSLNALRISYQNFGPLLIPILLHNVLDWAGRSNLGINGDNLDN